MDRRDATGRPLVRRAVHLASDPATGARVNAWLAAAGVSACRFDCPYAFCAALSTAAIRQPELALIGTDLLDEAELAIVEYLRRRWPGVPLVLYGRRCDLRPRTGPVLCLASPAALRETLRGSPDELIQRIVDPRRVEARVVEVTGPAEATPVAPPESRDGPTVDRPSFAAPRPPSAQPPAHEAPITSPLPLRSLLSPEELAALLEGPPHEG